MTKYFVLFLLATLLGSSYMPLWWNSPHAYLFNIDQTQLYKSENKVKPDLTKIKENLYMPIEVQIQGMDYKGLLTVKPQGSKLPRLGGAIYSSTNTDELSLLEGEITEKENHYEVSFKAKNASKMFRSKKYYQSHTDFPLTLEIRSYGENNTPYLIAPLDSAEALSFQILPLHVDIEKPFVGKWKNGSAFGYWNFEFSPLPGGQISGTASFESQEVNCNYPVWGFPVGRQQLVFLTGDSAINTADCKAYSWIAMSEEGPIREFQPYNHDGYSMILNQD